MGKRMEMKIKVCVTIFLVLAVTVITGVKTSGAKEIVTDLSQGQSGKIYYEVPKGLDLTDIISGKTEDAQKKVIYGKLYMPSKVKAFIVLAANTTASEQEIIDFCRQHLPKDKCPKFVEFLNSLPKSSIGKILRKELRKFAS